MTNNTKTLIGISLLFFAGMVLITAINFPGGEANASSALLQPATPTFTPTPTPTPTPPPPSPTETPSPPGPTNTPVPPYPPTSGNRTAENMTLEGHWGGSPAALSADGAYLYAGMGPELAIFDRANPAELQRVGYLTLINETQPAGAVQAVAVSGGYAYVADGKGLRVVDVSNPAAPAQVGYYGISGGTRGVAVAGNYAYLAAGSAGLRIIDVSDPANPAAVSFFFTQYSVDNVVVANDMAYLVDGQSLYLVDVADPARPVGVGLYAGQTSINDVLIAGNYVYLNAGYSGLRIVDVSNPAAMVEVGSYVTQGWLTDFALQGGYIYLAVEYDGLYVVDISDPTNPTETGLFYEELSPYERLTVAGDYAYLTGRDLGWRVLDISNPANPTEANLARSFTQPRHIARAGDYAYLLDFWGLHIIDISSADNPLFTGYASLAGGARRIAVAGDYAYIAAGYDGLQIFDVSNPVTPTEITTFDTPGYAGDVAVAGNYAYVADGWGSGLRIIDISNPAAPVEAGVFYDPLEPSYPTRVVVVANYAYYITNAYGGVQAVDVSDPANPIGADNLYLGSSNAGLSASGNYIYYSDKDYQLAVIDISVPGKLSVVSEYTTDRYLRIDDIAVAGNYVYLASGYGIGGGKGRAVSNTVTTVETAPEFSFSQVYSSGHRSPDFPGAASPASQGGGGYYSGGVLAVDVSDPANPYGSGYFATGGEAVSVAAAGDLVYVADRSQGLFVLRKISGISGRVTDANGISFADVTITANTGLTTTTRAGSGAFTLNPPLDGSYTIIPTLANYTFEPVSRTVAIPPDAHNQDFTIIPAPVGITLQPGVPAALVFTGTQGSPTQIDFSAEAVTEPTTIILTPLTVTATGRLRYANHAFELAAYRSDGGGSLQIDLNFNGPVTVTVAYSWQDLWQIPDERKLGLWYQHGPAWQNITEACVFSSAYVYWRDTVNNRLTAPICKTGRLAMFGVTSIARGVTIASVRDTADGWESASLEKASELGLMVLIPLAWSSSETAPGVYNWAELDDILKQVSYYNYYYDPNIIFRVYRPPEWRRPLSSTLTAPPTDSQALYDFMNAMVGHINDTGYSYLVAGYVIWNEPNIPIEWGGLPADAAAYMDLLKAGYNGAKDADPNAKIISAGLAPTETGGGAVNDLSYLQQLYDNGLADYVDYVGFNGLGFQYAPDYDTGSPDYNFNRLKYLRQVMLANGDAERPVWALEVGWLRDSSYDMGDFEAFKVSAEEQGQYLHRARQKAENEWAWLELVVFWNLDYKRYYPPTSSFYWYSIAGTLAEIYLGPAGPVAVDLAPGSANGLYHYDSKGMRKDFSFPANTVSKPTNLVLAPTLAGGGPGLFAVGDSFELKSYQQGSLQLDMPFERRVRLSIQYGYGDYLIGPVSDESALMLLWWNGAAWQDAADACQPSSTYTRDLNNNYLSLDICRAGRFVLVGPTHQVYLPLILVDSEK